MSTCVAARGLTSLALLLRLAVTAAGTDLGGYVWASNDTSGGSFCDQELILFDCVAENGDSSGCDGFTTLEKCLDECDADPLCRWVTHGFDSTNGGYYRCTTFMACTNRGTYLTGDPQLYYRQPASGTTTYDLAFNSTFCDGSIVFDCFSTNGTNLLPTYRACHPEFYNLTNCQATCDARSDCRYMLWGYDTGGDFFRCTLFDACSGDGEYLTGDVQVWLKAVSTPDGVDAGANYSLYIADRICDEEHQIFDCLDLGDDNVNDCAPYSTRYNCEKECEADAQCRFYSWGWDDIGHWRCITFTSCDENYGYETGSPNIYRRPSKFEKLNTSAFCATSSIFDCLTGTDPAIPCSAFQVLADCEALCDDDPECLYMAWGRDYGLGWRCATFAACPVASYDNGLVSVYAKILDPTAAPTHSPTAQPTPSPTPLPTFAPTLEPTALPTPSPTPSPTFSPTFEPTALPTPSTTPSPTFAPTFEPTAPPTSHPTFEPTASPTVRPTSEPTASPTAMPTPAPTARYCLRITMGGGPDDPGVLNVSVDTGGGLLPTATDAPGSAEGDRILQVCYSTPVRELEVANPAKSAWAGTIEYSSDAGGNFASLVCHTCTVAGNTSRLVVDGEDDGGGEEGGLASSSQCMKGLSCKFVPREKHCVMIVAGSDKGSKGTLEVSIHGVALVWAGNGSYGLGDYVVERCFEDVVLQVFAKNPTTDAWHGSIMSSSDFGVTWESLLCPECTGGSDSGAITVGPTGAHEDADDESDNLAAGRARTKCLSSDSKPCTLVPKDATTTPLLERSGGDELGAPADELGATDDARGVVGGHSAARRALAIMALVVPLGRVG